MSTTTTPTVQGAIASLIQQEERRQREGIELIASENFVSDQVREALGSILTNKYAEGLPGKRYYGGCEVIDEIENLAIERAKQLFNAGWANVQPHSGSQANAAVMLAVLNPGDTILGFDLAHGGHLTHGSTVNFSGKYYKSSFYGVERETGMLDWQKVANRILEVKPKLVICGASAYSRDWDYATLRQAADEVGALLLADIAHTAGFIACGLLNNPLPHCHMITTTTHKTLRGPRAGMILMGEDFDNPLGIRDRKGKRKKMTALLESAVFPGTQGGPHEHVIAAKAIAFQEALTPAYTRYMQQVRHNAQAMTKALETHGYTVVSGGTDNHLFLLELSRQEITGKEADQWLGAAGITVNKNMVPFDTKSPFTTSGIRIGTPAITTRGLGEKEAIQIVALIHQVLESRGNPQTIEAVKQVGQTMMQDRPLFMV